MTPINQKIIGVVGHPSSGKDTAAEYLVKKYGFSFISTSDMIRDYIRENDLGEPTRERMHDVVNEWRAREGGDILIRKALEKQAGRNRIVFGGLRAIAEAEAVKNNGGVMIAVTAPIETRFARAKARGRIGDDVTFEQFKSTEDAEAKNDDPYAQNVSVIIASANYTVNNNGTHEALHKQIDQIMLSL